MKYFTMLGLLGVAAAVLMLFANTASATLTSPAGTPYGGTISLSATNVEFHGSFNIKCGKSAISFAPSSPGATSGKTSTHTFTECGSDTVTVLGTGSLSITPSGTVTSNDLEVTFQVHRAIIGIPITTHCILKTNNTDVGTLTESVSPPKFHIVSAPIPEVETDGACGDSFVLTGTYTAGTPSTGIVVD